MKLSTRSTHCRKAGRFERGLELARSAVDRAKAVDYPPVLARALYLQASLEDKSAEYAASEATYYEAARAAGAARDDRLTAATLTGLVTVVGGRLRRHEDAMMLTALAEAAVARAGSESVILAELLNSQGKLLDARGKYGEAQAHYERSLAIRRQALGARHPDVARTLNNLAVSVYHQGKLADAETLYREAIALAEDVLGARHPHLAAFLSNLGSTLSPQGKYDEARALHERALEIRKRALGPDHPHVANSLGQSRQRGSRSTRLRQRARLLHARARHRPDRARISASRDRKGTDRHRTRVSSAERPRRGSRPLPTRRGDTRRGAGPEPSEPGSRPHGLEPSTAAARPPRAGHRRPPTGPCASSRRTPGDPVDLADARFALARAQWEAKRDRPHAIDLARQARDAYANAPDAHDAERAEVDTWLGERQTE